MAVQTGFQHHLLRRQTAPGKVRAAERLTVMGRTVMAVLAEERRALFQKCRLHRPMGRVADRALFLNRRVLPQERPALLIVTGQARVIDGRTAQHRLRERSMRIMTIRTGHAAFQHGMVRRFQRGGALVRMTREADRRLGRLYKYGILNGVGLVTVRACNIRCLVQAALPMGRRAAFMATGASRVAGFDRGSTFPRKDHRWRRAGLPTTNTGHMVPAVAMAVLAPLVGNVGARVGLQHMRCVQYGSDRRLIVAVHTAGRVGGIAERTFFLRDRRRGEENEREEQPTPDSHANCARRRNRLSLHR